MLGMAAVRDSMGAIGKKATDHLMQTSGGILV